MLRDQKHGSLERKEGALERVRVTRRYENEEEYYCV